LIQDLIYAAFTLSGFDDKKRKLMLVKRLSKI